ncbi:MAG: RES domain-containing protein [Acidobacteriota bacterium]|nr:RES domain-containing protein [Acidobacteriota bacterium]
MVQRKLAKDAFSGEGARRYGGRWNPPGVAMVYTAGSQSLAALEIIVHYDAAGLLDEYVVIQVEFDDSLVTQLDCRELPNRWRDDPAPAKLQEIGGNWAASEKSVALEVPSATIPAESNFLLNPRHPAFAKLRIGKPERFGFDARLAGHERRAGTRAAPKTQ